MGLTEPGGDVTNNDKPAIAARHARAAVLSDNQRQLEMEFGRQEALTLEEPTERNIERVEEALGDLDGLENNLSVAPSHARS